MLPHSFVYLLVTVFSELFNLSCFQVFHSSEVKMRITNFNIPYNYFNDVLRICAPHAHMFVFTETHHGAK